MQFKKDVFISYAHIDNKPLPPEQIGWISRFHDALEAFISMRTGGKVEIWRDDRLRGTEVFEEEIVAQFPETALLISVLTPRYVCSEWCTREIHEFCETARKTGGLVVDHKSRVIKVIKTPIESEDELPEVVRKVLGYQFYILDEHEAPLELDPAFGSEYAQAFNRKIGQLAWDIRQLLKTLREEAGPGAEAADEAVAAPAVFLAECSYDRRQDRERLEAELKAYGYPVLPDAPLPLVEDQYVAEVAGLLEECRLSIHLIGTSYGAVPDGPSGKSAVVLQNNLAVQRSRAGGLARVIWLPEDTRSEQASQQAFIDALHRDPELQLGADLITGDFEHLKSAIHAALEKPQSDKGNGAAAAATGQKLVYLMCNESDRNATVPISRFLLEQGLDVNIPAFKGDAAAVREANRKLLTDCDAAIIFYGDGDEAWKRTVDNDLIKARAYRGGRPLGAVYTYLAEPASDDKDYLIAMHEPDLINGLAGFPAAELAAFAATLNAGGAAG
jgi:hypothetical protein